MNEKLYAVASKLTDEERKRDRGAFFKSVHGTLNHLLLADRVWMARFAGVRLPEDWMGPGGIRSLDQELYADFEELLRERERTDKEIEEWVAGAYRRVARRPSSLRAQGKDVRRAPYGGPSRTCSTIRRTTEDK